jgi:hypothetical protein
MTVTHQTPAPRSIRLVGMGDEKRIQFGFNRLRDQFPRTLAQQVCERVR